MCTPILVRGTKILGQPLPNIIFGGHRPKNTTKFGAENRRSPPLTKIGVHITILLINFPRPAASAMAPQGRRISAAAARSHTRRKNSSSSSPFSIIPSGFFKKLSIAILVGLLALSYKAIQPPPPKICGSPNGPPITSPRIQLKDGRHISYIETGVPKEEAKYKFIFLHGLSSCKYDVLSPSKQTAEEHAIYMLSFDRPGYGESDPHPERSVKTNAQDIEELADKLELGDKFYVVGYSFGGGLVWGCLKYIPHRLAGAALLAPASNLYWPSFPTSLANQVLSQKPKGDQWAFRVAHYAPWLSYWWNTQKWFPSLSVLSGRFELMMSADDLEVMSKLTGFGRCWEQARQQGEFESIHRDLMVAFGGWEFDPMDLVYPIVGGEGMVHVWQGDEDRIVNVNVTRFVSKKLSWIKYHEVSNGGHMFGLRDGMGDRVLKALVVGEDLN